MGGAAELEGLAAHDVSPTDRVQTPVRRRKVRLGQLEDQGPWHGSIPPEATSFSQAHSHPHSTRCKEQSALVGAHRCYDRPTQVLGVMGRHTIYAQVVR